MHELRPHCPAPCLQKTTLRLGMLAISYLLQPSPGTTSDMTDHKSTCGLQMRTCKTRGRQRFLHKGCCRLPVCRLQVQTASNSHCSLRCIAPRRVSA